MSRSGDFGGDDRQTTDRQTDCLIPAAHARTWDSNCEYQLVGIDMESCMWSEVVNIGHISDAPMESLDFDSNKTGCFNHRAVQLTKFGS